MTADIKKVFKPFLNTKGTPQNHTSPPGMYGSPAPCRSAGHLGNLTRRKFTPDKTTSGLSVPWNGGTSAQKKSAVQSAYRDGTNYSHRPHDPARSRMDELRSHSPIHANGLTNTGRHPIEGYKGRGSRTNNLSPGDGPSYSILGGQQSSMVGSGFVVNPWDRNNRKGVDY